MPIIIGLDFETYSPVDLFKHGLDRYVSDPEFRPLVACLSIHDTSIEIYREWTFDFISDPGSVDSFTDTLIDRHEPATEEVILSAHNVGFELAVLRQMGIHFTGSVIDSAMLSRGFGGASSLEAAAPQLLGSDKLEIGKSLIQLFAVPQAGQESRAFDTSLVKKHPSGWQEFQEYCMKDAELSRQLTTLYYQDMPRHERSNMELTLKMNQRGWPVDMDAVHNMQQRYLENLDQILEGFRQRTGADDLNLNSHPQLVKWCEDRGIRAKSFDEKNVGKMLKTIEKKLAKTAGQSEQNYEEVADLLRTKQALGGSSLTKLQTIIDTIGEDGRLRDQYVHIGAGQTWRTSGRGVQMQNLKRLHDPIDMDQLFDSSHVFSNDELAENLRQVFRAEHPDGQLIVGDFSSVESRGLAWLAGAEKKLQAFRDGKDLYKVLAADIYGKPYDSITKDERQFGKVGELSCGYQAGAGAVKDFAEGMGVILTEGESSKLVRDWRSVNPEITKFWQTLQVALDQVMQSGTTEVALAEGNYLRFELILAPQSLRRQTGDSQLKSLKISMYHGVYRTSMVRVFHGIQKDGRFWKATNRKTGDLWTDHYMNPKTKRPQFYQIYGGKLAGILTQSFCRELFFNCLRQLEDLLGKVPNAQIIGQFHDEIVVEWWPGTWNEDAVIGATKKIMSDPGRFSSFPLSAEVQASRRYIK